MIAQTYLRRLSTVLVCTFIWCSAQAQIDIDGIYIDAGEEYLPIEENTIIDTCVITFDIPGINEFMEEEGIVLRNVRLLLENIEMSAMPAFIPNTDAGIINFTYHVDYLTQEEKEALYNIRGKAEKKLLIGIKLDEQSSMTYHQRATIFFSEVDKWSRYGIWLVIGFTIFYIAILYVFRSIIKDRISNLTNDSVISSYSFSKSQLAFWSFIVIGSFIYILGFTGNINTVNATALVLIGISATTTTVGQAIGKGEEDRAGEAGDDGLTRLVNYRKSDGNFLQDILSDSEGVSIHRLQALIFNIVFGLAFVKSVVYDYTMPEYSEVQLALLGLSNGTYAFLKNSEQNDKK